MNATQDDSNFDHADAHLGQHHRAPPKPPTEPPPPRISQTRQIILATIAMILLLLALLVDAHYNGQRTTPPPATPSPTATEIPPGQLTAIATAVQQFPALERRPPHLPTLAPGQACPTVPAQRLPYPTASYGPALGQGPVYATGFHLDATLAIGNPARASGKASFTNLMWIIAPGDAGLAVVRGKQLDGTHPVRFNGGYDQESYTGDWANAPMLPMLRLLFPDSNTIEPSYVRLQAPGCYAMQVDGPTFSEVLIFTTRTY